MLHPSRLVILILLALVACADETLRIRLGITPDSQVAVVNSEGATDPPSYAAILAG